MPPSTHAIPTRRAVLRAGAAIPAAIALTGTARAAVNPSTDDFTYEVTRTDEEWRAMLTDMEYEILRHGATEPQHSSLNAFQMADGVYRCRGCDLEVFDSTWKVEHFDIGWAFFAQARPNAVLTAIDNSYQTETGEKAAVIECHCRRCGSHFGHILNVKGEVLHCLNGSSLVFHEA